MNILAKIILLIASSQISDQIPEVRLPYEALSYPLKPFLKWQVPDDLKEKMYNKTDEELAYEDCMESYSLCTTSQKTRTDIDRRVCALDKSTARKATFRTICEMMYENCKNDNGAWGYFHDGPCEVEFVQDPEKQTLRQSQQNQTQSKCTQTSRCSN